MKNKNIFLTGFMGSGKSTVGSILAEKLDKKFIDLDLEIEKIARKPISQLILDSGEAFFRKIESECLSKIFPENFVIALGGGSLIDKKNQELIKDGFLIYLMAEEKTLINRLENSHSRPLLKNKDYSELFSERHPGYMKAHFFIKTDNFSPSEVANKIIYEMDEYERE